MAKINYSWLFCINYLVLLCLYYFWCKIAFLSHLSSIIVAFNIWIWTFIEAHFVASMPSWAVSWRHHSNDVTQVTMETKQSITLQRRNNNSILHLTDDYEKPWFLNTFLRIYDVIVTSFGPVIYQQS